MASIRHRTSARDSTSWQVLFRADGKQKSRTLTTERGAREFAKLVDDLGADEALAILADRQGASRTTPTLAAWAREHVESLSGVQEGTRARYRAVIDRGLGPLAARPVDAITPAQVARWVNGLERDGLAGKTISNRHGFLSGVMKHAVRDGLTLSNPCEGTRLPKTERADMVSLTGEEFAHLLSHVPARAHDLVACLPGTGLRFGEITALQAQDVDPDAATLTVVRAWKYAEGKGSKAVLGPPKTKRSRRTISLPPQVVAILRERIATLEPEALIFTNSAGKPWTRSRFHEGVWQPAVRAARSKPAHSGDEPACPVPAMAKRPRVHDMRHTCASWMIRAGAPMPVVQRHLGHESITTTIDTYSHLEPSQLAAASAALGSALTLALPAIES